MELLKIAEKYKLEEVYYNVGCKLNKREIEQRIGKPVIFANDVDIKYLCGKKDNAGSYDIDEEHYEWFYERSFPETPSWDWKNYCYRHKQTPLFIRKHIPISYY